MSLSSIVETVQEGRILISDGAWGTFLQRKGLQPGDCPELWSVERPDAVLEVARAYVEAGADMVQANSFGGSRFKLEMYGLQDRVAEINRAAAEISRRAAGADHWVIASVGPTGKMTITGEVTEDDLVDAFAEQTAALVAGGADAVCIETMSAIDEACAAVRGARQAAPGVEVIVTFTFEKTASGDFRTMMGVDPESATQAVVEAGADIVGSNCGNGFAGMIEVSRRIRAMFSQVPILIHANAGLPRNVDGRDVFPEGPDEMAAQLPDLIAAGANVIGGCCGTTPAHIRAMRERLAAVR